MRQAASFAAVLFMAVLGLARADHAHAGDVGFTRLHAAGPDGTLLEVGIWYPTDAAPSPQPLELYTQTVAPDAPVAGSGHGLILVSHGNGGSLSGHYDTARALASDGFVVAAVTHAGDNYRDHSNELRLQDRPPQIRAVLDFMLSDWSGHATIDPARIGMFGFSAGGFTTLVAIGGKPELTAVKPYCDTHATNFVCGVMAAHGPAPPSPVPDSAWRADARIKAAVIAAPALGFTFRAGLAAVSVPVQLWAAEDDHILPIADNAVAVRDALPVPPDFQLVPGADHFDFLAPCSPALARVATQICADPTGFDRAAFHLRFNAAIVRFFDRTLGGWTKAQ